jgi:hypothetical protein
MPIITIAGCSYAFSHRDFWSLVAAAALLIAIIVTITAL